MCLTCLRLQGQRHKHAAERGLALLQSRNRDRTCFLREFLRLYPMAQLARHGEQMVLTCYVTRTVLEARTSSILLVVGLGSYLAYRLCLRVFGPYVISSLFETSNAAVDREKYALECGTGEMVQKSPLRAAGQATPSLYSTINNDIYGSSFLVFADDELMTSSSDEDDEQCVTLPIDKYNCDRPQTGTTILPIGDSVQTTPAHQSTSMQQQQLIKNNNNNNNNNTTSNNNNNNNTNNTTPNQFCKAWLRRQQQQPHNHKQPIRSQHSSPLANQRTDSDDEQAGSSQSTPGQTRRRRHRRSTAQTQSATDSNGGSSARLKANGKALPQIPVILNNQTPTSRSNNNTTDLRESSPVCPGSPAPTDYSASLRLVWEEPTWDDNGVFVDHRTGLNQPIPDSPPEGHQPRVIRASRSPAPSEFSEISTLNRALNVQNAEKLQNFNRLQDDLQDIMHEASGLTAEISELLQRSHCHEDTRDLYRSVVVAPSELQSEIGSVTSFPTRASERGGSHPPRGSSQPRSGFERPRGLNQVSSLLTTEEKIAQRVKMLQERQKGLSSLYTSSHPNIDESYHTEISTDMTLSPMTEEEWSGAGMGRSSRRRPNALKFNQATNMNDSAFYSTDERSDAEGHVLEPIRHLAVDRPSSRSHSPGQAATNELTPTHYHSTNQHMEHTMLQPISETQNSTPRRLLVENLETLEDYPISEENVLVETSFEAPTADRSSLAQWSISERSLEWDDEMRAQKPSTSHSGDRQSSHPQSSCCDDSAVNKSPNKRSPPLNVHAALLQSPLGTRDLMVYAREKYMTNPAAMKMLQQLYKKRRLRRIQCHIGHLPRPSLILCVLHSIVHHKLPLLQCQSFGVVHEAIDMIAHRCRFLNEWPFPFAVLQLTEGAHSVKHRMVKCLNALWVMHEQLKSGTLPANYLDTSDDVPVLTEAIKILMVLRALEVYDQTLFTRSTPRPFYDQLFVECPPTQLMYKIGVENNNMQELELALLADSLSVRIEVYRPTSTNPHVVAVFPEKTVDLPAIAFLDEHPADITTLLPLVHVLAD